MKEQTLVYLRHSILNFCQTKHNGKIVKDDDNYTIIRTYDFDVVLPKRRRRGVRYVIGFCRNKKMFAKLSVTSSNYRFTRDEVTRLYKIILNETSI